MVTHDIGNFFWGVDTAIDTPPVYKAPVHETDYPFRCAKAMFIKFSSEKALCVGLWKAGNPDVIQHLMEALRGRVYVKEESAQVA